MNYQEYIRWRNDNMSAKDVIKFYEQALHNNRNWLETAKQHHWDDEIERIEKFIESAEYELERAKMRLT